MVINRFTLICALLVAGAVSIRPQRAPESPTQFSPTTTWVVEGNVIDDRGPVADVSVHLGDQPALIPVQCSRLQLRSFRVVPERCVGRKIGVGQFEFERRLFARLMQAPIKGLNE